MNPVVTSQNILMKLPVDALLKIDAYFPIPEVALRNANDSNKKPCPWKEFLDAKLQPILDKWRACNYETSKKETDSKDLTDSQKRVRNAFVTTIIVEGHFKNFHIRDINYLFSRVFPITSSDLEIIVGNIKKEITAAEAKKTAAEVTLIGFFGGSNQTIQHRNIIHGLGNIFGEHKLVQISLCKKFLSTNKIKKSIKLLIHLPSALPGPSLFLKLYGQLHNEITLHQSDVVIDDLFDVMHKPAWRDVKKITLIGFELTDENAQKLLLSRKTLDIAKCELFDEDSYIKKDKRRTILYITTMLSTVICGSLLPGLMGFTKQAVVAAATVYAVGIQFILFMVGALFGLLIGYTLNTLVERHYKHKSDTLIADLQEKINKAVVQNNRLA